MSTKEEEEKEIAMLNKTDDIILEQKNKKPLPIIPKKKYKKSLPTIPKKYDDENEVDNILIDISSNKKSNKKSNSLFWVFIIILIILTISFTFIGFAIILYMLIILITFHYAAKYERMRLYFIGNYSLKDLFLNSLYGPIFLINYKSYY
jgi:hypothetical protein